MVGTSKRIVITGIGVIASNGVGKDAFWKSLEAGQSGIKDVSIFDISNLRTKLAGEIKDFNADTILGPKGLRNMDRSTKLALAASKLAMDDAGVANPIDEYLTDDFGVSIGSTMGSVWSISEFDKEALREGPRSVNPALFPNTVINSPASQISIRFNIKGFNSTMATGFCSSLDAIFYAVNMMTLYGYKSVLAGGVEEMCEQTYKGFYKIGHLAGSRAGKDEINCPFDKRRNGIVFGEGSAVFFLEDMESANTRGAKIYAEILGYGSSFDPASRNIYSPKAKGAVRAMEECLDDAGLDKSDIGYVSSSANSTLDCDAMESVAVNAVFGSYAKNLPVSSVKSMIGETYSASGAMGIASAIMAIENGIIPPTVNYSKPDKRCDIDCVPNEARKKKVKYALVDAFSPTGSNSVLAIGDVKK